MLHCTHNALNNTMTQCWCWTVFGKIRDLSLTTWHSELKLSIKSYCYSFSVLSLFRPSWLCPRYTSASYALSSGVPQGPVLCPLPCIFFTLLIIVKSYYNVKPIITHVFNIYGKSQKGQHFVTAVTSVNFLLTQVVTFFLNTLFNFKR